MTLIVARADGARIRILSDSRVTAPLALAPDPLAGALKVVVVNHSQVVCFAGDVEPAERALRDMFGAHDHLALDDALILERLAVWHNKSDRQTDFILASVIGGARLFRIIDGAVEDASSASWIGNHAAFARYQELYHSEGKRRDTEHNNSVHPFDQMNGAFLRLVEGGEFEDVGDFIIGVKTHPEGVGYSWWTIAHPPNASTSSAEPVPVQMGAAHDGAYSYAVLAPDSTGLPLVGVYFAPGRFGFVLSPLVPPHSAIIDAQTVDGFVDEVERRCGHRLRGLVPTATGFRHVS